MSMLVRTENTAWSYPRRIACRVVVLACAVLLAAAPARAQITDPLPVPTPALSAAETAWLKAHPVIRIGVDPAYAPYAFLDGQGRPGGVAADFSAIISKQLGIRMQVVPLNTWEEILLAARDRRIDVITTAVPTEERRSFLRFTRPYIPTPLVIMTRDNEREILRRTDLPHRRVALVRGYSSTERVLREVGNIDTLMVENPLEGLRALAVGRADAYVGVLGVNIHLARLHGINNLRVAAPFDLVTNSQSFGVRSDWPELTAILDKALDAIPEPVKADVFERWIAVDGSALNQQTYALTEAEKTWIAAHPVVRVGLAKNDAPLSFVSGNGSRRGLIPAYLEYLSQKTGIVFEVSLLDEPRDIVDSARLAAVDAVVSDGMPAALRSGFAASIPLYSSFFALFQRSDMPSGTTLAQLAGKTVTIKDPAIIEVLRMRFPSLRLDIKPSLHDALAAVAGSRADAAIAELNSGLYVIEDASIRGLKLTATVPQPRAEYRFIVRRDWPELVAIVDRALLAMPRELNATIRHTAFEPPPEYGFSRAAVARFALAAALLFVLAAGIFFWRNYRLRAQKVQAEERLRLALDAGRIGTFDWDMLRNRVTWSRWHELMWGYQPGEFGGTFEAFAQRVHPDDLPDVEAEVARCISTRQTLQRDFRVVWPDASVHWIMARGDFTVSAAGRASRMRGVVMDITDRRRAEALLAAERNVLEQIAADAPLDGILDRIARTAEMMNPQALCSVLLLDADGIHVHHGAGPSLPDAYNQAVDGQPIGPQAGSCGTAAYRNEQVIVTDIATDPLWTDYRALAMAHGLRACWSTPIRTGDGRVLGTFALYYREPRAPAPHELELIAQLTHVTSIAIERKQAEAALLRLEHVFRHAGWGMAIVDPATMRMLSVNPAFAQMHGYAADELEGRHLADTFAPESRGALPAHAQLVNEAGHHIYESVHLRKDGSRFPCLAHATNYKDSAGRVLFRAATFEDVTEQKQAEQTLRAHAAQLKSLSRRLIDSEESERRRINRELHDQVGQNLAALKLGLEMTHMRLPDSLRDTDTAVQLRNAGDLLQTIIAQVRDVMAELRPPALDEYGLVAALQIHARSLSERLGTSIALTGQYIVPRQSLDVEIALFRIAQEALTNIAKHARAQQAGIHIEQDGGRVRMIISDDGVGYTPGALPRGQSSWGTATMRERAEAIGATLEIESAPGTGTRVIVIYPIKSTGYCDTATLRLVGAGGAVDRAGD